MERRGERREQHLREREEASRCFKKLREASRCFKKLRDASRCFEMLREQRGGGIQELLGAFPNRAESTLELSEELCVAHLSK